MNLVLAGTLLVAPLAASQAAAAGLVVGLLAQIRDGRVRAFVVPYLAGGD